MRDWDPRVRAALSVASFYVVSYLLFSRESWALVGTAFVIYFTPMYVAILRERVRLAPVALVNLLFGWTVIGWIVALIWATTGDTKRDARAQSWIVDAPAKPAPKKINVATLTPRILPGGYEVEVVGESHYVAALDTIADDGATQAWADLVVEDDNPYDRNAVRVEINGQKVGYLSREVAPTYRPVGLRLRELGYVGRCAATIRGSERRRLFGVFLDLASPEEILKEFATAAPAARGRA